MKQIFPDSQFNLSDAEKAGFQKSLQDDLDQNRAVISKALQDIANGPTTQNTKNLFERQVIGTTTATDIFPYTQKLAISLIDAKVATGEIEESVKRAFLNKLYNDILAEFLSVNNNLSTEIAARENKLTNNLQKIHDDIEDLNTAILTINGAFGTTMPLITRIPSTDPVQKQILFAISEPLLREIEAIQTHKTGLVPSKKKQIKALKKLQKSLQKLSQTHTDYIQPYRNLLVDPAVGFDPSIDGTAIINNISTSIEETEIKTFSIQTPVPGRSTYSQLKNEISRSLIPMFTEAHNNYIENVLALPESQKTPEMKAFITELSSRFNDDIFADPSNFSGFSDVNSPDYFQTVRNYTDYIKGVAEGDREQALEMYIDHILSHGVKPLPTFASTLGLTCESPFTTNLELQNLARLAQQKTPPLTKFEKKVLNTNQTTLKLQLKIIARSHGINSDQPTWEQNLKEVLKKQITTKASLDIPATPLAPAAKKAHLETKTQKDLETTRQEYARISAEKSNTLWLPSAWVGRFYKGERSLAEEKYRKSIEKSLELKMKKFVNDKGGSLDIEDKDKEEQIDEASLIAARFIVEQQKTRLAEETEIFYENSTWKRKGKEGFWKQAWRYSKHNSVTENALTLSNTLIKAIPPKVKLGGIIVASASALAFSAPGLMLIPAGIAAIRITSWLRDKGQNMSRGSRRSGTTSKEFLPTEGRSAVQDRLSRLANNPETHIASEQAYLAHSTRAIRNIEGGTEEDRITTNQEYLNQALSNDTLDNSPYLKFVQEGIKIEIQKAINDSKARGIVSLPQEQTINTAIKNYLDKNVKNMHKKQEHYKRQQTRRGGYAIILGATGMIYGSDALRYLSKSVLSPMTEAFNESIYNPLYESIMDSPAPGTIPNPTGVIEHISIGSATSAANETIQQALENANHQQIMSAEPGIFDFSGEEAGAIEGAKAAESMKGIGAEEVINDLTKQTRQELATSASVSTPVYDAPDPDALDMYQDATTAETPVIPSGTEHLIPEIKYIDSTSTSSDILNLLQDGHSNFLDSVNGNIHLSDVAGQSLKESFANTYSELLGIDKTILETTLNNPNHSLHQDLLAAKTTTGSDIVLSGKSLNYLMDTTNYGEVAKHLKLEYADKTNVIQLILNPKL